MSPSLRHVVTALAVAAALVPATAHADAPPATCGIFQIVWPANDVSVFVDTVTSTVDSVAYAAACGIVAAPLAGTGATTVTLPSGDVCSVALTTQTYAGVAYNLQHGFNSLVGVHAETRCTTVVDSVAQRVDAIVGGAVVSSAAGPTATDTDVAWMVAAFSSNATAKRSARYCVDITTGSAVTPACATSTPI